jgi:hypothetical protein
MGVLYLYLLHTRIQLIYDTEDGVFPLVRPNGECCVGQKHCFIAMILGNANLTL